MSEEYVYQLVQFVRPGPKSLKSVDCVPSSWISFHLKRGRLVCKFLPPPYADKDSCNLLHDLVRLRGEVPEDWPEYLVDIKGSARTHDEAMSRLNRLYSEEFAFSHDSDVTAMDKAENLTKKYKESKLFIRKSTQDALKLSDLKSDSEEDIEKIDKIYLQQEEEEWTKEPVIKRKQLTQPSKNSPETLASYQVPSKSYDGKSRKKDQRKKGRDGGHTSDSSLLLAIYEEIQGLKVSLQEVILNQQKTQQIDAQAAISREIKEDFIGKYNLDLPLRNKIEFDKFDSNLLQSTEFREDFMTSLGKYFHSCRVVSKSLTNIMKKHFSRQLALQFTVSRQMPNKFLLKETGLYDCLLGVFTETYKDQLAEKQLTEAAFANELGNVLGTAKDWDGHRTERAGAKQQLRKRKITVESYQNQESNTKDSTSSNTD